MTDKHFCSACGEEHGGGSAPEVEIARINARRDVEVARIQRGESKQITETAAETEVAVAELEAVAAIEVAGELADAGAPPAEEPETIPVLVDGTPAEPEEAEQTIEPSESTMPEPSEPKKSKLSYW